MAAFITFMLVSSLINVSFGIYYNDLLLMFAGGAFVGIGYSTAIFKYLIKSNFKR